MSDMDIWNPCAVSLHIFLIYMDIDFTQRAKHTYMANTCDIHLTYM